MVGGANLVEVFSSIQGEGPEIGTRTLFVRFGECDLRCSWCDTPHSWTVPSRVRVRSAAEGSFEQPNPIGLDELERIVRSFDLSQHRWLSLTGGEPLLQPDAVAALATRLVGAGPSILLETHGLHAEALDRVIATIELVSMDWKLASDVRRREEPKTARAAPFHEAHERFLEVARAAPRVVVKLVLTPASEDAEVDRVIDAVARIHPAACLVLQPVTPHGPVRERPAAARLHAWHRRACERLAEVRVIPQAHPLLGVE